MQGYDLVMLAVLAGAALLGAVKGLAWQIASMGSIFVSYFVAYQFRDQLSVQINAIKPAPLKSDAAKFIQGYVDAIYIPISNPSEIGLTVPKLFSNNLSFFVAGTGDWNSETSLQENKAYFKNLVFESEYYPDESDNNLVELKARLKKPKYKLNKSFLFGYDAMSLILHLISEGYRTRQMIYEGLKNTVEFRGIKSKISLNVNRLNTELNILTYHNGIKLIQTYKLQK